MAVVYFTVSPGSVMNTELEDGTIPNKDKFWGTKRGGGLVAEKDYASCRKSLDQSDEVIIKTNDGELREGEDDPCQAIRDLLSDPKYTITECTHAEIRPIKRSDKWHEDIE